MIRCAHQTVVQDERNDAPTRPSSGKLDRRICVAPMMEWTDRHCRYFLRGFSPRVLLYTEMITAAAILRGDRERLLGFDPEEHPVALQLGGNDPDELAAAARIGAEYGYDEINLNCGCPSDRVADGSFGACLMAQPQRVAECVAAMRAAVKDGAQRLAMSMRQLDALSPLKVMMRGYSLVYDERGERLIRSIRDVQPGDMVNVRLADGRLECHIWSMRGEDGFGGNEL